MEFLEIFPTPTQNIFSKKIWPKNKTDTIRLPTSWTDYVIFRVEGLKLEN